MDNFLITAIILYFSLRAVLTEPDLHHQNAAQDHLNPINDHENADTSAKDQDKRTIFNSANYGWAKHVGIKPSGHKFVLGYSPVDLKYTPVIRPLKQGYMYGKPKIQFHIKRPIVLNTQLRPIRPVPPVVWRPLPQISNKPVVSVAPPHHHHLVSRPAGISHVDHVHVKPVHHVDHVHPVHVDHVHNVPVHVDHVHSVPVQSVHVDHVHPVPIQPAVPQPVPIQPVALPQPVHVVPQPVPAPLPQHLLPVYAPQFIPSPLFEVTKPDLGVLPLGATFPSPVLRNIPQGPAVFHFPVKPAPLPQQILPFPQPVPVPRPALIPQPVALPKPALVPQQVAVNPPGTFVEYHGVTNFVNSIPLPQVPVNAVQPLFPAPFNYPSNYPQIPQQMPSHPSHFIPHEQHDVQMPVIPANHPHFIQQAVDQNQFQQQPPLDVPSHFQQEQPLSNPDLFQQQLPFNTQHMQFQSDQNDQHFMQDSGMRYQPADQVSTQQFFQGPQQGNFEQLDNHEGGYIYQQPEVPFGQQTIQPGESDLQLPVHLPQHPGFVDNSRQFQDNNFQQSSHLQSVFRPSIQLEPPYKK